jgi:hypothetical protein
MPGDLSASGAVYPAPSASSIPTQANRRLEWATSQRGRLSGTIRLFDPHSSQQKA